MVGSVGDKMKIYINENHEIKAINSTNDDSLTEIEIDKNLAFGNMSDFMILNYCYKQDENGYSIYPASDYSKLVEEDYKIKIDESQKKISILEAENEKLKAEQKQQNEDILMNMLATTEMYELNKAYSISTLGVKTDKKVPTYIQATYQKLYELGVKDINEIPFEVRINLKAK